ncbi:uncharacterized protein LOC135153720 [Lytechinus pictus]|uniref:uncharacterized protein LOC135153720 n=1 Tax=Lytechinus pictus TaxID=7653 RepID=UPI0030B9AEA1
MTLDHLEQFNSDFSVISKAHQDDTPSLIPGRGRGKGGVAIFSRNSVASVAEIKCNSPRLLTAHIQLKSSEENITVINCYLPSNTSPGDIAEYQNCLCTISEILASHPHHVNIVAGDFNADIISRSTKKPTVAVLKDFIATENLISLNVEHCTASDYTFMSDDSSKWSNIDGFLISSNTSCRFHTLSIHDEHPMNTSDHRLVTATFSTNSVHPKGTSDRDEASSSTPLERLKIDWPQDHIEEAYTLPLDTLCAELFQSLPSLTSLTSDTAWIDKTFETLSEYMITVSQSLPHKLQVGLPTGKKEWTEEVAQSYKQAHRAWIAWKAAHRPMYPRPEWIAYIRSKKLFRRSLRQSRAILRHRTHKAIEFANSNSNPSLFFRLVKENRRKGKSMQSTQSLDIGGITYNGKNIIAGFEEHFRNLGAVPLKDYNNSSPRTRDTPLDNSSTLVQSKEDVCPIFFTSRDLDTAICSLKKGKASGVDNIMPEHVIHSGPICRSLLLLLFNACMDLTHIPEPMKQALVLPIHKGKGKPTNDPSSYRGISLTPTFSKVLELLLKPHLESSLRDSNIPDELQFGFQKGRSCILTSACLQLSIEINSSYKNSTYVAFLDAQKAFDCVWHDGLFKKIRDTTVHPSIVALLAESYKDANSKVLWEGRASNSILLEKGVRQGAILSPSLYTLFIDNLIKTLKEKGLGCSFQGRYTGIIVLADDVALLASSAVELQEMLSVTHEYTKRWQYSINPSKSAVVVFNEKYTSLDKRQQSSWMLAEGQSINKVLQQPHLGITKSSMRSDPTIDIIARGLRTFYSLHGVGAYTSGLSPHLCAKLWTVFCVPRMLYGSSIVSLTSHQANRINIAQNQLFKKILGIPQSAANESVFLLTGITPLMSQVELDSLLIIGQLTSLSEDRFEKRAFVHASIRGVPLVKSWNLLLFKYNLPTLLCLIEHPIPYHKWKAICRKSIYSKVLQDTTNAIASKSSLSFWKDIDSLPPSSLLFPEGLAPHLRKAQIIRAQLLTQTYPTQKRLSKIGKSQTASCLLCKDGDEDTLHLISSCSHLHSQRVAFMANANKMLPELGMSASLHIDDPLEFALLILLPNQDLSANTVKSFTTLALNFLLKIHMFRSSTLES